MTDKTREAFEQAMVDEGRPHQLEQHPLHPGIYAASETTRRFNSFKAGIEFARAHYAPTLTEQTEKANFWSHEYKHLAHAGVERLAEYGHVVDPAEKIIEAAKYREAKTLRAAGVRFKEEA